MKNTSVIVSRPGGVEAMQVTTAAMPEPGTGEVRVRIMVAGVSYADLLMREGVHPETPPAAFVPGWDLVGEVDKVGDRHSAFSPGQIVAALPIVGGYAEYICLPEEELVPMPEGADPVEAVSLILNYVTAYQMIHRTAQVKPGERVLIHAAAGGVGTALLQLGHLAGLEMYGTASTRNHALVASLNGTPIDYHQVDFVEEIRQLTNDGVDVVFDGIGGRHVWRSYRALRPGGRVIAYGLTSTLKHGRLSSGARGRARGLPIIGIQIGLSFLIPDRRRIKLYSIQTLKRLHPTSFREDLQALFRMLLEGEIKPAIAAQLPLREAAHAHDLLAQGVRGKIVLYNNEPIHKDRNRSASTSPNMLIDRQISPGVSLK